MNTYTLKELQELAEAIRLADLVGGPMDSPNSALNNVYTVITDYQDFGLNAIQEKLLEYAKIGEMVSTEHPILLVYQLIYEMELGRMPEFINSKFELIATWRLCLPKKTTAQ